MTHPTRRIFLKAAGVGLVSLGWSGGPAFLHRAARAASTPASSRRPVLVTIFQRGAMDGLMAVPPLEASAGAARLARLRPGLAMSGARGAGDERLLDLGVGFGLHPALGALEPMWRDGSLGIVHAVGSPDPTRSHFDAQDYMETGTPGRKGTSSGWLNRVVGELGHEGTPFRAVALTPALPRSLYGEEPALAVARLDDFRVASPAALASGASAGDGFEALYDETSERLLHDTGRETFEALAMLEQIDRSAPRGSARYPRGPLGDALRQIAFLIKADVGLEVAFAESGGWDTHVRQGTTNGSFAQRARDLAESIAAFWSDLGARRSDVVVLTMTEFGRTVHENGSGGTDHGHASCLFVLGEGVAGGRVHGRFPGLEDHQLFEGRDLAVTTDFRAVFAGVAGQHLGIRDPQTLFPGWGGRPMGQLRG